jgi:hypothetical protein
MWIPGVDFGRASAAWRPLAAIRWIGATPQPPWCRWGEGCGIAAPVLRAARVGGRRRHLQTWPRVCRRPEIRRAQRRRPFCGPGPVLQQHRPAGARAGWRSGGRSHAPRTAPGPGPVCGRCVSRPAPSAHREFYAGDLCALSCYYHTHVPPGTGSTSLLITSTTYL